MHVRDHERIQRRLGELRQGDPRITQRDIAAWVGWRSHSLLGRIARGETRTVEDRKARRLAHILGIPVDDIFMPTLSTTGRQNGNHNPTSGAAA